MILITGGAGFIGSNIAARLCDDGHEVVVCDWLGDDNIKWQNLKNRLLYRITAPEALGDFLASSPDLAAVVHMGAISATTASDADLIVRTNIDLSQSLWRYCAESSVPFIYASSAATYGDGSQGFRDDNDIEQMKQLQPLNLYGWSKKFFDLWALSEQARGRATPPKWAGLKFFNVYGPNELHKGDMMSIVSKNREKCAAGEEVPLFRSHRPDYEDGGQLRDFVFVDDCVDIVSWLLSNRFENGVFNVGSGQARSFRDLIAATFKAAGQAENIRYIDMPASLRDKYQYFTEADMTRLRQAGYNGGGTSIERGVEITMRDYLLKTDPHR
ncbi:ADP-glyceromanno-heptose 6-epimerase [Stappia indica]|uniref:ADP-glyceromanno-heptose 6-epimerase n=1 Tax=Stappia indica TaxID=538381 RepID=UPI001CD77B48|nr:ADP-glyceromanno-heptose 6-epimerase [Stappia indica]MCA1300837.1 ADP-glyceromanno-heptose 6-epimerase [Stappia indica]